MVSKKFKIVNSQGLHMRPASTLAAAMGKYGSDVKINFNGRQIDGKSVMNLMAACIKFGSEIELICSGDDEEEALKEAAEMIETGFGEE